MTDEVKSTGNVRTVKAQFVSTSEVLCVVEKRNLKSTHVQISNGGTASTTSGQRGLYAPHNGTCSVSVDTEQLTAACTPGIY